MKRLLIHIISVLCFLYSFNLSASRDYDCQKQAEGEDIVKSVVSHLGLKFDTNYTALYEQLNTLPIPGETKQERDEYEFHVEFCKAYMLYITHQSDRLIPLCEKLIFEDTKYSCEHLIGIMEFYVAGLKGEDRYSKILKALKYIEKSKKKLPKTFLYRTLANMYFHLKQYTLASINFKYLLEFDGTSLENTASLYNNIGLCYTNTGNPEQAEIYFKKALEYWNTEHVRGAVDKMHYDRFKEVIKNNISELNSDVSKSTEAIYQSLKDEHKYFMDNGLASGYIHNNFLLTLAGHAYKLKKYDEGNVYLKAIEDHIKKGKGVRKEDVPKYQFLLLLKQIQEGNIDKALVQSKIYKASEEEFSEQTKRLFLKASPIDNEWKTQLLTEREKALNAEKQFKLVLYLLVCILIVFLVLIYQGYFSQKQSGKQIANQKKQIEQALKNTEMLLKEVHHRVKNNLQLVTSIAYIEYEKNDEQFDFQSFENRIISLSLIHRLLYSTENISDISLNEYIKDLMVNLQNTSPEVFTYNAEIEIVNLPLETAITFGLLINELVTNTVKHCKPPGQDQKHIDICFYKKGKSWNISYMDNGTLFIKPERDDFSLGNSLIELLIRKLRGEYTSDFDNGYVLHVSFESLKII